MADLDSAVAGCPVRHLTVDGKRYRYYDVAGALGERFARLPFSVKVVVESMVRRADKEADEKIAAVWRAAAEKLLDYREHEGEDVLFQPSRVLLQDFTGVPALVDLAAIRDALVRGGVGEEAAKKVDSLCPADLVVDHSVQLDYSQIAAKTAAAAKSRAEQQQLEVEQMQQQQQQPPTLIVHSTFPPPQFQPVMEQQWHYAAPQPGPSAQAPVFTYFHPVSPYQPMPQMPIQATMYPPPPPIPHPLPQQKPPSPVDVLEVPNDNPGLPIQDEICPFHQRISYWSDMLSKNQESEFGRNKERFSFLKWVDKAFDNITVIPPGTGVMHQVNLEYLARVVTCQEDDLLFPDSLVGTDTHTTMINGLGVLGWGVGTLDAESIMFGHPIQIAVPRVIGCKITGAIPPYATSTEIVLLITKRLRHTGVANCFVEFFGAGVSELSVADRATIANMCPEYGALVGFFPTDELTIRYLEQTGRDGQQVRCIREYLKAVGMFRDADAEEEPRFSSVIEVDLSEVQPCVSGPKRTKDKMPVDGVCQDFQRSLLARDGSKGFGLMPEDAHKSLSVNIDGSLHTIRHGSVLLAAISSCSNTSNPSVMLGAGLLARKAIEAGLSVAKYVKTSLSPGSGVVTSYLHESGVMPYLYMLGFEVVGYGCSTCVNNSRPLPVSIVDAISQGKLVCCGVLSGNRNFEGRIQPDVKANYLASPMLVIAYAIAGRINIDFNVEPLGFDQSDRPVFLRDIWPSREEIQETERRFVIPAIFRQVYSRISYGNKHWSELPSPKGEDLYPWDARSTFIQPPSYVEEHLASIGSRPEDQLKKMRCLVKLGDNVTSDHISPAGSIVRNSPAADYLASQGLVPREYNSYGARRGNCEVMVRGAFAHPRLRNMLSCKPGPYTVHFPSEVPTTIYEASKSYRKDDVPLFIIAGENLGRGTPRDWATKGLILLGVKAVLAIGFDANYRSNLVRAGILPIQIDKTTYDILTGRESIDLVLPEGGAGSGDVSIVLNGDFDIGGKIRLDNAYEVGLFESGGMVKQTIRRIMSSDPVLTEAS